MVWAKAISGIVTRTAWAGFLSENFRILECDAQRILGIQSKIPVSRRPARRAQSRIGDRAPGGCHERDAGTARSCADLGRTNPGADRSPENSRKAPEACRISALHRSSKRSPSLMKSALLTADPCFLPTPFSLFIRRSRFAGVGGLHTPCLSRACRHPSSILLEAVISIAQARYHLSTNPSVAQTWSLSPWQGL
jgi:hypothetical protein